MKKNVLGITLLALTILCMNVRAEEAKGNLRYSVSVAKFKNESGWHGQWEVGDGFSTMLTDALQQSGQFIVLGDTEMRMEALDEQNLVASGRTAQGKKSAKTGRLTPAQLLVRGSITHVQRDTTGGGGGLRFKGISIGGSKGKAEVNITMYLVDSETGQVKSSTKVVGKSGKKGLSIGYHGSKLGGLTGNMAGFKKDNLGKACQDAVDQGVMFLVKQLESTPWQATILLAKSGKIILNRGSREGVTVGTEFSVGMVEELVDEDTGEVLDVDMTTVGAIRVTSVKEKVAYCEALEGGEKIAKGQTAIPKK